MFDIECKFLDFILRFKGFLFFILINIIALIVRISGFDFISGDMKYSLIYWYEHMRNNGGINAINTVPSDYNYLYKTFVGIISYFKYNCVYMYKIFSMFFDWIIAISAAECLLLIKKLKRFQFEWNLIYTLILFLPTIILNSSFWGQCDGIYTAFLMLSILFILKEKYLFSFIFYGTALAFKLQAILILPFLVCYYLKKKKFSFIMFFASAFTLWLSGIAGYLKGAGLLSAFQVYFSQTHSYKQMYLNFPSFWVIMKGDYSNFHVLAVLLTFTFCIIGLYAVLCNKKKFKTSEQIINTLCWFLWTSLLFLPAIHERYAYPLDLFLLFLCFIKPKYIKYFLMAEILSILVYSNYFFGGYGWYEWSEHDKSYFCITAAIFYIIAYFHYTYSIFLNDKE